MEFVKGGGVLCGYCECVPVRHEKLADPNSKAKETAHNEQENQPRSSIWKDVSLGWIPDPKGDYTRLSNSLLAEFYQCFWATCPFKDSFRLEFTRERKHQWDIKEMIKKANNKVSYIASTNTTAAGKFMQENFQAKEHDSKTITNNINALGKAKGKLKSLSTEITEQDNALFMANELRLKPEM